MNLVARILLIVPFIQYAQSDVYNLILLTFGLLGLLLNIHTRMSLICVAAFLLINKNFDLNTLWVLSCLLLMIPKIDWQVVPEKVDPEIKPEPKKRVEPEIKIKPEPKKQVDPWAKYRERENFIDWFLGKNTKKFPPYFYCLICTPILGIILILIIDRLVHY